MNTNPLSPDEISGDESDDSSRSPVSPVEESAADARILNERVNELIIIIEDFLRRIKNRQADASNKQQTIEHLKKQLDICQGTCKELQSANATLKLNLSNLQERYGKLTATATLSDRRAISVFGSDSQPDKIATSFHAFRKQVDKFVHEAKRVAKISGGEEGRLFSAHATAALTSYLFPLAASRLGVQNIECREVSLESAWGVLASTRSIFGDPKLTDEFRGLFEDATVLVRRIVISTSPNNPGQITFVKPGDMLDHEAHEEWPGPVPDIRPKIEKTVFPGYSVGNTIYVRAQVLVVP